MEDAPTVRKGWELNQQAFDGLLAALDPDRNRAGEKYETLRRKLTKFFSWQGCSFPEDRADDALNRVARRLAEGEAIRDLGRYVYGVAQLISRESVAEQARARQAAGELRDARPSSSAAEAHTACLERCLARLVPESRNLILRYYQGERGLRIRNRQALARELEIPLNALRNRALRLRERLAACVAGCAEQPERDVSGGSHTIQWGPLQGR